jgi:hypothetical protein
VSPACGFFGPKKDEVRGGWKNLCSEDLHNLYSSPNIIAMVKSRRMRWAGHTVCMVRSAYRILVGTPERKRLVWRLTRGWVVIIKMDPR